MEEFIKPTEQLIKPFQKILIKMEKQSLEDDCVKIIGTRPPISCNVSPIGQNIVIPNTNRFSEKRPDHNRQTCGQHDSSYYQPQPAVQNHCQQHFNNRRIKQAYYKNDYDRDKGVAHVMINSGIPTLERKSNTHYSIGKGFLFKKKT